MARTSAGARPGIAKAPAARRWPARRSGRDDLALRNSGDQAPLSTCRIRARIVALSRACATRHERLVQDRGRSRSVTRSGRGTPVEARLVANMLAVLALALPAAA